MTRQTKTPAFAGPALSDAHARQDHDSAAADTLQLAADINAAHAAVERSARDAVEQALHAGAALTKAKAAVPYGQWGGWLAANIQFSDRLARAYMQLADNRELVEAQRQRVADLAFRDVLRFIAKPKPTLDDFPWTEGRDAITYSNGRLILISESRAHPGYYDWSIADTNEWFTEASRRPCRADSLHLFLGTLGAAPDAEWRSDEPTLQRVAWLREAGDELRNEAPDWLKDSEGAA